MVFYRKYRPQKIEELDSKSVRDKLYSVLENKSVSHAFLFTGPKGLGKTSAARIVAKVLNCERKNNESRIPTPPRLRGAGKNQGKKRHDSSFIIHDSKNVEPCNKCNQCVSITSGTNLDILEIDGASNRGIDEIRDLREKVKLSPMRARKKVYIIDEVHMLTTEAFNALLKTLEEPPSHVVFILCTTEPHKVPATIKSRCLQIQFKKAAEEELIRSFERIAKAEKLKADTKALNLIASLSDGSFRDGAKILEEMVYSVGFGQAKDKKITTELIENKYHISSIKYHVSGLITAMATKDTKKGLELIAKLAKQGVDMKYFIEELINDLHKFLLIKMGIGENPGFKNSELGVGEIKTLIELLSKANSELKYAVLPQIPLELVIVEWGLEKTQNQVRLGQNTQIARESDSQKVRESDDPKVRLSDSPSFPSVPKIAKGSRDDEINSFWKELIDKVRAYNHSIAGVLRGCSIKSYDGKTLLLETNFKFHKDKLSEPRAYETLEKVAREITKKNINVEVLLKEK